MTRRFRERGTHRRLSARFASFAGATGLVALGLVAAAPAAHAEVTVAGDASLTATCSDGGLAVVLDGAVTLDAGDSATSYLRVDGVAVGEPDDLISEIDDLLIDIVTPTIAFADGETHLVEWIVDGVVVTAGEFSSAESCADGGGPIPTPAPAEEGAVFSDAVCTEGTATATVTVHFSADAPAEATTEVTIRNADTSETLMADMDAERKAVVEFAIADDGPTVVSAAERHGAGLAKELGSRTYELAVDCAEATPTPTPTPTEEPTPTPTTEPPEPTEIPEPTEEPEPVETQAPVPAPEPTKEPVVPVVTVSSTSIPAGGSVTVNASGFAPGEKLEIWLRSDPWKLTDATADASGAISLPVGIAGGTDLGEHQIEARGATSGSAFVDIVVTDDLAITGIDTAFASGAATTGIVLVLGGLSVFLLARRAREAAEA
ncbi:hypothetical protein [Microbacterium sp. NPDC056234]|uniref:hypothetical protein n=1 Tax=Microbacterium sp. NPDC056234 TaxID=3345757 RepID=UPI0035DF2359